MDRPSLSAHERASVRSMLHHGPVAFLAVTGAAPYVVPINFAYDGPDEPDEWGKILFHSGEGVKSRALAEDPRVCLAILGETSFDRGALPCNDGFAYRSVLVEGRARLLTTAADREHALRMIVAKYDPESARSPFDERALGLTLVYSVEIDAVSFKQRETRP